jgi:acetyl-CoA carboxylase biotin carboxyl carrier protein
MAEVKVAAELAGTILKLEAEAGQSVGPDDTIMILESMKMEIPVFAGVTGRILKVHVAEGDEIAEGQLVATIATGMQPKKEQGMERNDSGLA